MKNFQKLNNIFGWVTFGLASIVYLLTIEPTASWWDCGEYIATAFKLQVGHPPGAPLFQIIGRFFSLFAFGDVTHVAMMVNIMSALSSSFTILFLFWTIVLFAKKIIQVEGEMTPGQMYTVFAAAFIGSMAYTFSDTFWFSAVEGEVYAMSSFFTAISFWAILKWESVADEKHSYRWLVLIAFLMGLAIGVHLLNLLVIPATCMVYYYKKYPKPTKTGMLVTFVLSILILAFIMFIIIPWMVELSGKFELLFVNSFGLPFNSGTIFYFLLLIGLIVWSLFYTRKKGKAALNTIILSLTFILIGYSSFLMLVIRANANTPINENAPKDAVSLLSYLNREQYGDFPIFHGQYYNAPIIDYADGKPVYQKDSKSGKYIVIDERKGTVPVWDPRFTTLFPRMWSNQRKGSAEFYRKWGGEGVPIEISSEDGKTKTLNKPTFGENLKYFFSYQIGHMYIRYFMWNFAGRQNDVQGFGGKEDGNWISGIPFLDKARLGHSQTDLPDSKQNRGTNKYYLFPLILGLIGFLFHANKDYKGTLIISLLFIMTGLAIVVYLNQQPYEPRERDYAYAASFYAFAIWIGLGVIPLVNWLRKKLSENLSVILVFGLTLILVPGIMAKENWDDHDRSGKYACRDFASDYLKSCNSQGILFTNGDNDTFPLWYAQEVEGVKTDVRVVNLMLSSGPWYIDQLYTKFYDSEPIPFTLAKDQYRQGTNDIIPFYDIGIKDYVELKDLIDFIKSDNPQTYLTLNSGERMKFFPSKKIKLTVDSAACVKYGIVPAYLHGKMVDTIYWTIRTNQLYKNDLMLLDLIASNEWKRPIYFAAPSSVNHCLSIDQFCWVQGWVYKFMPVKADSADYLQGMGGVDPITSYDILKNRCAWGNLNDPHVYVDPESLNNSVRPKTNCMRVAQSLQNMGKNKEAIEILDLYIKYFPDSKIPFDMYMLPFAEIYYRAGATEKGNKLVERIGKICSDNLDYYYSYGPEKSYFEQDIQTSLGIIKRLGMLASANKQTAIGARMDTLFNMKIRMFE
ncbi:MAG: DUF2723 domain-containing protein [Bacteroidales bacterium]|nr:DUF2723 domain-containing protein [Bacteroidales bacterium]HNW72558.1 DUF2723 domain-containing protein [Bacteroidales bacterium]HPS50284.1 DUF2723 domain-containing protein [Bacteroidales bacterium]